MLRNAADGGEVGYVAVPLPSGAYEVKASLEPGVSASFDCVAGGCAAARAGPPPRSGVRGQGGAVGDRGSGPAEVTALQCRFGVRSFTGVACVEQH